MKAAILIFLLLIPTATAMEFDHAIIADTFYVNDSINLTIKNSVINSDNFLAIDCYEEECYNISINITVINSYIYTDFIIYSDEINTENIYVNNNYYHDYNNIDSLYVWEHNHDIIDYNPKRKVLKKKRPGLIYEDSFSWWSAGSW